MKKIVLSLMLGIVSLCFFIANSYSATVVVSVEEFKFNPENVHVNVGDTVKWVNNGNQQHTTTNGTNCNNPQADLWDSTLNPGQTFEKTFTQVGEFPYLCRPHCNFLNIKMIGTVIVEPGGQNQNGTQWRGRTSFSMTFTSINTDSAGKFATSKQTFKGTIQFITLEDKLLADEGGCFIKFLDDDNVKRACFTDKALLETFNMKSKTDQLSLIGTGAGVFPAPSGGESETGPAYLDTKGTLRKNTSGNVTSIDLIGKIAGGARDDDFIFSGSFRSTLKPVQ